jgi:hypothetical protein
MSNHHEAPVETPPSRLGVGATLVRLALIGLALAAIAGTFAYIGGWFSPNELTPRGSPTGSSGPTDFTPASVAITPRESAFPGSSRATAMASVFQKRVSSKRDACR